MKRTHVFAALVVLVSMTACSAPENPGAVSTTQPQPVAPVASAPAVVPAAPAAPAPVAAREGVADQAEALLGRGETRAAVELLTKAAAEHPSAEIWNLLSYAHLLSGAWDAAAEAGYNALRLEENHAYARYNTGMAELERKQYPQALASLRGAAELQPERAEPYLALTRAYRETGRHALAIDAAAEALKRAPGKPEAVHNQLSLGGLYSQTLPADITTVAAARLEDGPYTLFLYPGKANNPAMVYVKGPARATGLAVGALWLDGTAKFVRVDLPGGLTGYFLSGEPIGAHVSGSRAWRLFVRGTDGEFRQAVFARKDEQFVAPFEDFVRAGAVPSVQGERLIASHRDDASGKTTVSTIWQIRPGEIRVSQLERVIDTRDPNK